MEINDTNDKKPSTRGKKKRMWNKVPVYMMEHHRGEMSKIDEDNAFWILVFTVSQEQYKNMPEGKKWDSQVWIYNVEKENWESKTVFGDFSKNSTTNNSCVDYYFYQHEYQRLIVIGQEFKCVVIYSFQGELIGEYRIECPKDLQRIFFKMTDIETLHVVVSPSNRIYKIDLLNKKKYEYRLTVSTVVYDILFYPQELKEKLEIMVIENTPSYQKMVNILFWTYSGTREESNDNSLREPYTCVQFQCHYQLSLHQKLFPDVTKMKWNTQQLDIPGLNIIPFALLEES